jgi:cell division FtsZ-interacting protein ZapD
MSTPVLLSIRSTKKCAPGCVSNFSFSSFHNICLLTITPLRCISSATGDLLDVIERGDVRTELLKELERQQRKLQAWAEVRALIRAVSTCASS